MDDTKYIELQNIYDYIEKDPVDTLNKYRNIINKDKSILEIWYEIEESLN